MVTLTQVQGDAVLQGIDEHGHTWKQFEIDYWWNTARGSCYYCQNDSLEFGWVRIDGVAIMACDREIEVIGEVDYHGVL